MHGDNVDEDEPHELHVEREADGPPPIQVPFADLAPETLQAVIESFVLREGTDYGERETALDTKVAQVMAQLQRGDARVMFDPASETVTIVRTRDRDVRVR